MRFRLDDRILCTIVGETPILLDLPRNRYLKPARHLRGALIRILDGDDLAAGEERALSALIAAGLVRELAPGASWSHRPPDVAVAAADSGREAMMPSLSLCAATVAHYAWAFAHLRLFGLDRTLHLLAIPRRSVSTDRTDIEPIAVAFRWFALFLSSHDRCLLRSIAMKHLCRARRLHVDLVIGIADPPFVAHCWIQWRDVVLNDDIDTVRPFTPLLAL